MHVPAHCCTATTNMVVVTLLTQQAQTTDIRLPVLPVEEPCRSWCELRPSPAAAAHGLVQVATADVTAALPCIVPAALLCDFLVSLKWPLYDDAE
jgi:hypothetical protein